MSRIIEELTEEEMTIACEVSRIIANVVKSFPNPKMRTPYLLATIETVANTVGSTTGEELAKLISLYERAEADKEKNGGLN